MTSALRKCVFFDRDGIVNVPPPKEKRYVLHWEDFHLMPEFVEALRVVHAKGYVAIIVTNQAGIGKGRMSQEALDQIHDHMLKLLRQHGVDLLDIMFCTSPDDQHPNRKPNPGMILDAVARHQLDLARSWMVGDQERDVVAGKRAGCKTVLVHDGDKPTVADHRLTGISQLRAFLEKHL